jgi:hypothetical protein
MIAVPVAASASARSHRADRELQPLVLAQLVVEHDKRGRVGRAEQAEDLAADEHEPLPRALAQVLARHARPARADELATPISALEVPPPLGQAAAMPAPAAADPST